MIVGSGVSKRGSNAGILVQLSQQVRHLSIHIVDARGSTIFGILGCRSSTLTSAMGRLGHSTDRASWAHFLAARSHFLWAILSSESEQLSGEAGGELT